MEGKAAFPQAIKRPYAGNRISRESGTSDTAEKRENENRRSGRNGVRTSSFFRRVACPAFSGDSVSGIRAFYRLRERRLAFHANMFYLFLL